jgi:hypothetical protein
MFHQIIMKLLMNYLVFNLIMYTQELTQNKWVTTIILWPQHLITILIIVKILFLGPLLILYDHVVQNNSGHDVPNGFLVPHPQGPLTMANLD